MQSAVRTYLPDLHPSFLDTTNTDALASALVAFASFFAASPALMDIMMLSAACGALICAHYMLVEWFSSIYPFKGPCLTFYVDKMGNLFLKKKLDRLRPHPNRDAVW